MLVPKTKNGKNLSDIFLVLNTGKVLFKTMTSFGCEIGHVLDKHHPVSKVPVSSSLRHEITFPPVSGQGKLHMYHWPLTMYNSNLKLVTYTVLFCTCSGGQ